ncbi:P-loop containing nucleoside triphosphate hydrolase protein [Mycena floridula]|nr:P-loop containing nucleoside triphosphate hydrolase protein [Mycena floridula]
MSHRIPRMLSNTRVLLVHQILLSSYFCPARFMTEVQAATIDAGLLGDDLLVQAKTGTGKTLGFLLPAIENIAKGKRKGVSLIIIAPTRELAQQIATEANPIAQNHHLTVKSIFGGTKVEAGSSYVRKLKADHFDILVATPGRLLRFLDEGVLNEKVKDLKVMVWDECDRLLDQGFKKDLDRIMAYMPSRHLSPRQMLFFSATLSPEVKNLAAAHLSRKHRFISTIQEDDIGTHHHVPQTVIIAPFSHHIPMLLSLIKPNMKAIVFLPTARQVALATRILEPIRGLPPRWELHSRISTSRRNQSTDEFRQAKAGILLASDVVARGVDFPGVHLVIQLGLPQAPEQYVHRLGRTARAGADGSGILVVSPEEEPFLELKAMKELPLKRESAPDLEKEIKAVNAAATLVPEEPKAQAYRAWMGYYNGHMKVMKWSKEDLVKQAFTYMKTCASWTDELPPTIESRVLGKMGLKGVPGLNIVKSAPPGRPAAS